MFQCAGELNELSEKAKDKVLLSAFKRPQIGHAVLIAFRSVIAWCFIRLGMLVYNATRPLGTANHAYGR